MERDARPSFVMGALSALALVWMGQSLVGLAAVVFLLVFGVLGFVYLFAVAALKWAVMALAVYVLFVLVFRGLHRS